MARRGRPPGPPKSPQDQGTDELRAHRERLAGNADDRRASYPLGVLYARRKILQGDHYAGRRYAALFTIAVRPLTIPSVLAGLISGGAMPAAFALLAEGADQDAGAEARTDYLAARDVLERRGPHIAKAVDEVAVYEHAPRTERQLEHLKDGLDALFRHFEEADARARATRAA